jgi:4-amino-4-deoxy-L-arabinose transferase-like glycosyltransferase
MGRRSSLAVVLALVALIGSLVLAWGVGSYVLYEPDEARHAEVAREMLSAPTWRGWMVPHLDGLPYRNKPAPFYWLMAGALGILGVNERGARAVSLATALVTVLAVTFWGARRWGNRAGALAGLVLVTAPEFALLGRFATLDMTLTLWTTLGMLAVHRFAERSERSPARWLIAAAVMGAFGMLTKGLLAPGFIAIVGLAWLAVRRRLHLLTPRALVLAAAAFLALVLPWHLAAGALDPAYLQTLFVDQQWKRAVEAGERLHARPLLFYVPILLGGFFPWSLFLPATIRTAWKARPAGTEELFCALWAAVVIVALSVAQGKVASYIVLAFPPLALLVARQLDRVVWNGASALDERLVRGAVWLVVVILAVVPVVVVTLGTSAYDGALARTSLWSLLFVGAAAGIATLLRSGGLRRAIVGLYAGSAALLIAFFHLAAPSLSEVHSDAALARVIRVAPEHATAPLVAYGLSSPSTSFYVGRPLLLYDRPRQLRALLAEHALVFVVTSPLHSAELAAIGPFVPWHTGARRTLYASRPP